jgi:hypothetical protein
VARPNLTSIWRFSDQVIQLATGILYVPSRTPVRFIDEGDSSIQVEVRGIRLLALISHDVYRGVVARPQDLWPIVADFQPEPILNPFLKLDVGRTLFLPSRTLLFGQILNERVRVED